MKQTSSEDSEKYVVRKSLAPTDEVKEAGSANNVENEIPRPPISGQSQLNTRNIVEDHVIHFGKPVAHSFVLLFQESWMIKTSTGSEEFQQLWQTEAMFQLNILMN